MEKTWRNNYDNLIDFRVPEKSEDYSNLCDSIQKLFNNKDIDLREYSLDIRNKLQSLETTAIDKYVESAPKVTDLHEKLFECDAILERLQNVLSAFYRDIDNISSDILELQQKSMFMHSRLQNRQSVRTEISRFLSDVIIPEALIEHVFFTNPSEQAFLENLHDLNHRLKVYASETRKSFKSSSDTGYVLQKLKLKSLSMVRNFILTKIYAMKKPLANYQIIQNQLLKFRFYLEFIYEHDRQVYEEIKNEYIGSLSKIFYSYFKTYTSKLIKCQGDSMFLRDELLGKKFDDGNNTNIVGLNQLSSIGTNKRIVGTYSVGDRLKKILSEGSGAPSVLVPHTLPKNEQYTFETIFGSIQYALFETCCREFLFIHDFFHHEAITDNAKVIQNLGFDTANILSNQSDQVKITSTIKIFDDVLGKTVVWLHKNSIAQINQNSYDLIGCLLVIQILQGLNEAGKRRQVPILTSYFESLAGEVWPKVYDRINAHIESMKTIDFDSFATACESAFGSSNRFAKNTESFVFDETSRSMMTDQPLKINQKSIFLIRPHSLSRRYSELLVSLYLIGHDAPGTSQIIEKFCENTDDIADSSTGSSAALSLKLLSRIDDLHLHYERCLLSLSNVLPRTRLRLIFLINNYDLIITVLREQNLEFTLQWKKCHEKISQFYDYFIELSLMPYFGSMISFVKQHESFIQSDGNPDGSNQNREEIVKNMEVKVTHIIKGFNIDWKNSIVKIHSEVMNEFSNYTVGNQIFQLMLTKLLEYYNDIQKFLQMSPNKTLSSKNQLISVHEILNEVKKFRTSYEM